MIRKLRQAYNDEISNFNSFSKHGYVHILAANLISRLSTTGFPLLLAFLVTSYEVGAVKIFLSYISFFVIFAGLGIDMVILKYCSEQRTDAARNALFEELFWIGLISSALIAALTALLAFAGILSHDTRINSLILIGAISIPFLIISQLAIVLLQAQTRFKEYARINILLSLISLPVFLILTKLYNLQGFIISYVAFSIISSLIILRRAVPKMHISGIWTVSWSKVQSMKSKLIFGLNSLMANAVGQLNYIIDVIMLSMMAVNVESIGFYSIAQIIVFGLRQLIMGANQITVPLLSKKFKSGKNHAKQQYQTHRKFISNISLLVFFGGLITIPFIIKAVFGERYAPAIPAFIILLTGLYFWSQFSINGITFLAYGRSDINLLISLSILAMNVIFNFIFIKYYGILGAAFSIFLTYLIGSIISRIVFIKLDIFGEKKSAVIE